MMNQLFPFHDCRLQARLEKTAILVFPEPAHSMQIRDREIWCWPGKIRVGPEAGWLPRNSFVPAAIARLFGGWSRLREICGYSPPPPEYRDRRDYCHRITRPPAGRVRMAGEHFGVRTGSQPLDWWPAPRPGEQAGAQCLRPGFVRQLARQSNRLPQSYVEAT